jgi:surface antigen
MFSRSVLVLLCAVGIVLSLPAGADPWKDESGHGHHRHKHHKHHKHKHRYKHEEHGPPPWAPAYGYREQHGRDSDDYRDDYDDGYEERQEAVQQDTPQVEFVATSQKIGIDTGKCNREVVGAVMGGLIGGAIGNTAIRDNRTLGTIAGTLIGIVVGKEIGRNMDKADAQCVNQALERAQDGQAVTWNNPNTGYRYSLTPYQTYQRNDGHYCRKYRAVVKTGSHTQNYREAACRNNDGVWERLPSR